MQVSTVMQLKIQVFSDHQKWKAATQFEEREREYARKEEGNVYSFPS